MTWPRISRHDWGFLAALILTGLFILIALIR